jgi:hypothetical protein
MYPDIGSPIGAVVIGYTEDDRNQIWLSVKPSVLQKALVHLKVPATSEWSWSGSIFQRRSHWFEAAIVCLGLDGVEKRSCFDWNGDRLLR